MAMGLGEEVEIADPEPEGPKNMTFRRRRAVWLIVLCDVVGGKVVVESKPGARRPQKHDIS
jgi:hypothetical protein